MEERARVFCKKCLSVALFIDFFAKNAILTLSLFLIRSGGFLMFKKLMLISLVLMPFIVSSLNACNGGCCGGKCSRKPARHHRTVVRS